MGELKSCLEVSNSGRRSRSGSHRSRIVRMIATRFEITVQVAAVVAVQVVSACALLLLRLRLLLPLLRVLGCVVWLGLWLWL